MRLLAQAGVAAARVLRVVLADHWARYAMVPYAASLSGAAERLAHARQRADGHLRRSRQRMDVHAGRRPPGCAAGGLHAARELIEELRACWRAHGAQLASLQPQLVVAYNHWRDKLPDGGAWFVSIEQGSLAAARLAHGGWDRVHSVRIGPDWTRELRRLQTFGRLAKPRPRGGRVYVDAPAALRMAAGGSGAELHLARGGAPPASPRPAGSNSMRRHQA